MELAKKYRNLITYLLLLFTILNSIFIRVPISCADELSFDEYMIKAAFIYNFAKFIEWPPSQSSYFDICILGEDPFGDKIRTINGKIIGPRHVRIMHIKSVKEIEKAKNCQILFICKSDKHKILEILKTIDGNPMLTIGDFDGAARFGITMNFIVTDEKVRFEINNKAALKVGIKISSNLLSLATTIVD